MEIFARVMSCSEVLTCALKSNIEKKIIVLLGKTELTAEYSSKSNSLHHSIQILIPLSKQAPKFQK